MKRIFVILIAMLLLGGAVFPAVSATPPAQFQKPMILPVAIPPGPNTWMTGQFYGNTTGAFNYGSQWYSAGQRLHFGLDLFMPCGTPLVAVADGIVHAVDATSFGSAPHNLVLEHPEIGVTTLYGHLLERPTVEAGQTVQAGDVVALSGEPRSNCDQRPHLHLEVRSEDFRSTFNPVDYIDAPWHSFINIGPFSNPQFQQDMDNARRWLSVDDQPTVAFGGAPLNNYNRAWPYPIDVRPPENAPLPREVDVLPESPTWELLQLGFGGCCARAWWHPFDSNLLYVIDGLAAERASVFEWTVDNSAPPTPIEEAPPMLLSPDGAYQVTRVNGAVTIRQLSDASEWTIDSQGALPAVSTDSSRLLWEVWRGQYLPGSPLQTVETWVSDLDGSNQRKIWEQAGGWAVWLDNARVLIVTPSEETPDTSLTVFDTRDDSSTMLGTWRWIREISVAPSGERIMFYLIWQDDPNASGIYSLEMTPDAVPQQLPFFGAWRWRDGESVYYVPFDPTTRDMSLAYYNLSTGEDRTLTDIRAQPFTVANGDWSVAPDGNHIAFTNARDLNLWVMRLQ